MRFLTIVIVALLLGACGMPVQKADQMVKVLPDQTLQVECSVSCAQATVARNVKALTLVFERNARTHALQVWLAGLARPKPSIPYNYGMWMAVHNCEQPDSWHAFGHFGNGLTSGGTGMGFSVDAVRMARGYAARRGVYLPDGPSMSITEQFEMAQAMLDATGSGPDCLGVVRR